MYSVNDIPIGSENAISRAELAKLWGVDDRRARERIATMRAKDSNDDMFIVSHSRNGVKGYYRTNNADEIRHFVNEGRKRLRNTATPIINARKVLKRIEKKKAFGKGIA